MAMALIMAMVVALVLVTAAVLVRVWCVSKAVASSGWFVHEWCWWQ